MIDEEHAIARRVLSGDDVSLLVNLILQSLEDSVDEVFISGLKHWHISQQPAAHHHQDLLGTKNKEVEARSDDVILYKT